MAGITSSLQMSWQPLQKRKGGPLGLRNLGNTCYLNSVLQCLTYTPPLANFCLLNHHSSSCNSLSGTANLACAFCLLERRIFRSLTIDLVADSPTRIHSCLSLFAKHFRNGCQEDAHEFLRYVIDACNNVCVKLHKMLSIPKSKTMQADYRGSKEDPYTVVKEIFGGVLQSQVKCLCCGSESNKQDEIMDLSLDVLQIGSLKEAMRRYFQAEVLDGNNKYRCEKCKKLSAARKQLSIFRAPNVLVIQLKRFENIHGGKIDRYISFEEQLELVGHMCRASQDPRPEYILYAVIVHAGYSQESGHYYSYVKDATGKWFCCNDAHVTGVSSQAVLNEKAYVLFYVRNNVRPKVKDQVFLQNGHAISSFVDQAEQPSVKGNVPGKCDTVAKSCSADKVQDAQLVKFKLVKAGPPGKNQKPVVHDNGRAGRSTDCKSSTEVGHGKNDSYASHLNGNLKHLENSAVLRNDVASQKQGHVLRQNGHSGIAQCAVETVYSASEEREENKPSYLSSDCHEPEVPPRKGIDNAIGDSENNCGHRERNPFMEKTNCRELHSNGQGYLRCGEPANSSRGPVQYRQQGNFQSSEWHVGERLGTHYCSKNQTELRPKQCDSVNGSHAAIKRKILDGSMFLDSLGGEGELSRGFMVADMHSNEFPCRHFPVDFELESLKHRLVTDTRAWLHRSGWCDTVRDSFRGVKRKRLCEESWSKDLRNDKSRYTPFEPRSPYNGKYSGGRGQFTHRRTPLLRRRFLCWSWMNGNQPASPVSNEFPVWADASHSFSRFVS